MANRDHDGGFGGRDGDHRGGEPWRGQASYGARYDQDPGGYGGQEYGMEGGGDHDSGRTTGETDRGWRGDERQVWRPGRGEPYGDLELDPRDRGIREFGPPADYAYHPKAGHAFDPDYLRWREARMRAHDRDYQAWRTRQQQRYDDDYRRSRDGRRADDGGRR